MATNLAIDDKLINEAKRVGRHKTKKEAVTTALAEYIQRHKQARVLRLFGSIDYDKKYDFKKLRLRDRVEFSK